MRGKAESRKAGNFRLIQIRDMSPDGSINMESLARVAAPAATSDHLLREGDVLLVARGSRNRAWAIGPVEDQTIAGAQLFQIRPNSSLLPKYLAWLMNERKTQQYLESHLTGSYIPFLPKEALEKLEIDIPPLETQRKIAELAELANKEQQILEEIKLKRRQVMDELMGKLLHRERI
jgi:restriction endonuclease S subunit